MTTRILLARLPREFHVALTESLSDHADLVVVRQCPDEVDLLLEARHANVVVVAVDAQGMGLATADRVLDVRPDLAVLAVDWTRRRAWLCRFQATREQLPDRSLVDLARTIRAVAHLVPVPGNGLGAPEPLVSPLTAQTHSARGHVRSISPLEDR